MDPSHADGATPLDADEREGLRLTHITTHKELNIFEHENIRRGAIWAFARRQPKILSEAFIRELHKRMLGDVWRWAGAFRTSNKNIGVDREGIGMALRELCDDTAFWIEQGTYEPDEIAARFHHRLVQIHPFPNGNGRHARLMADLLLEKRLNRPRFSWGGGDLRQVSEMQDRYIAALRAADDHDYGPLMAFVRS